MPSWFVSSWSKILCASASCDVDVLPLVAVPLPDESFAIAPVALVGGLDGGVVGVDGAAVEGIPVDVLDDGPAVFVVPVDDGVDCASVVPAFDADVASEVVAQAVPAIVMMPAAQAVTSCR